MKFDLEKKTDGLADTLEGLTSTQTSRTGHAAARVASLLANDVDPEVVALQITKNSQKNNPNDPLTFTAEEVHVIAKFHAANKTRSAITKRQTGALKREQGFSDNVSDLSPAN